MKSYSRAAQARIRAGCCGKCGQPRGPDGTSLSCRACADAITARTTARRQARWAEREGRGICVTCDEPAASGLKRCDGCAKAASERGSGLYERRAQRGHCRQCSRPRLDHGALCLEHWMKARSKEHWGHVRHWRALLDLAVAQGWRCHYTGDALTPGLDMSLDHKVAKAHPDFPGPDDMANLAWTTRRLNLAKNRMSDAEFIDLCRKVLAHTALLPVEGGHFGRPVEAGTWAA